jgi:hypothetical protein
MDEQALARQIAAQVLRNTQFWIAIVGVIGAVVGALLTLLGNILLHWLAGRKSNELDEARKKLLQRMLDLKAWRRLSTLSRVIGADVDTTKRLLIEIGARGSESPRTDNEEVWGLISQHPLDKIDADPP